MTTDKPGAVAVQTATKLARIEYPNAHHSDPGWQNTIDAKAAIIQAAIDEATGAVEAERDRAKEARIQYAEKVSAARDERDKARTAARELGEALLHVRRAMGATMPGYVTADVAIKKHAALLAEPEDRA